MVMSMMLVEVVFVMVLVLMELLSLVISGVSDLGLWWVEMVVVMFFLVSVCVVLLLSVLELMMLMVMMMFFDGLVMGKRRCLRVDLCRFVLFVCDLFIS